MARAAQQSIVHGAQYSWEIELVGSWPLTVTMRPQGVLMVAIARVHSWDNPAAQLEMRVAGPAIENVH